MNIDVPGSGQHRSYSFSSAPGNKRMTFMIKQVPGGLMSSWLGARPGRAAVQMTGPLGSFYLRAVTRPLLFLAGGTGLAPFLAMLEVLAQQGSAATRAPDLRRDAGPGSGDGGRLVDYARRIPGFTFGTCVADPQTSTNDRAT